MREIVEQAHAIYVDRIGRRPAPMDDDYASKARAGRLFVADHAGVVGLIVLVEALDHLLVENVAVAPSAQGRGIGRVLLGFAETVARDRDLPELRLYTNAAMSENLELYPRLGYHETGRRVEHGFDRVFFCKPLREHGTRPE